MASLDCVYWPQSDVYAEISAQVSSHQEDHVGPNSSRFMNPRSMPKAFVYTCDLQKTGRKVHACPGEVEFQKLALSLHLLHKISPCLHFTYGLLLPGPHGCSLPHRSRTWQGKAPSSLEMGEGCTSQQRFFCQPNQQEERKSIPGQLADC